MNTGISERYAGLSGLVAPFLVFIFTITSILFHPWFSFSDYAFSHLGEVGLSHNYIFNLGVILGGVAAVFFSLGLLSFSNNRRDFAGAVAFGLGSAAFILLGVFPMGMAPHRPAAGVFYIFSLLGIILTCLGDMGDEGLLSSFVLLTVAVSIGLLALLSIEAHGLGMATIETIAFIPILEFEIGYGAKLIFY